MDFEDVIKIKDWDREFIRETYNDRRRSEKCDIIRHDLLVLKMEGVHVSKYQENTRKLTLL